MANTSSDKISYLLTTKTKIANSIKLKGVDIPSNTPFRQYSDYIDQIDVGFQETSELSDLMTIVDLYEEIHPGYWKDKLSYDDKAQQELLDLVNLILEGE